MLHAAAAASTPYQWHLPRGLPTPAVPADNPMSDAKVALGRRLFSDNRLSLDGQHSCASCHDPSRSFTDGRPVAVGATGQSLPHNAMALVNVAYNVSYGWTDPKVASLEAQMLQPLLNQHPIELGTQPRVLVRSLTQDMTYANQFAAAFPAATPRATPDRAAATPAITFDHVIKAIAAYERTLVCGDSDFDRYVFGGRHDALSPAAKRGMALFFSQSAGCGRCHFGFNFSGHWRDSQGATGKASFANNGVGIQRMRIPTLRNIAQTAPYMHGGRFATLEAVVDHYAKTAEAARRDSHIKIDIRLRSFNPSNPDRDDLLAFLQGLTDHAAAPAR